MLAAAAQRTSRLRLGTLITILSLYHPMRVIEEAMRIANRAFARFKDSLYYLWKKYDIPIPPVFPAETFEGIHAAGHFYAGDPAGAREWVARHRDIGGINYMALETCFGDMAIAEALQSAELLATEVMPHFA